MQDKQSSGKPQAKEMCGEVAIFNEAMQKTNHRNHNEKPPILGAVRRNGQGTVNSVLRTLVMAVFTFCALYILVEFLGKEPRKGVVFVGKLGNQTQLKTVTKELEMNNIKSFFLTRDITESRQLAVDWQQFTINIDQLRFILPIHEEVFEDDRANSFNNVFSSLFSLKGLEYFYDYVFVLVLPKENSKITLLSIEGCLGKYLNYLVSPQNGRSSGKDRILLQVLTSVLIDDSYSIASPVGIPALANAKFLPSSFACSLQAKPHYNLSEQLQQPLLDKLEADITNQTVEFNSNRLSALYHSLEEQLLDEVVRMLLDYMPLEEERIDLLFRGLTKSSQTRANFIRRLKSIVLRAGIVMEMKRSPENVLRTTTSKQDQKNRDRFIGICQEKAKHQIGQCSPTTRFDPKSCSKDQFLAELIIQPKNLWESLYMDHIVQKTQSQSEL